MQDLGKFLVVLGLMAYVPPLFNFEWILSSWLGSMQGPIGLSAMIVGGVVFGVAKLIEFRNGGPGTATASPAHAASTDGDPAGPIEQ